VVGMERRLIRERWQVTIPRGIRRKLNLFVGQTVNFHVDLETGTVLMFTGSVALPADDAAFQEIFTGSPRRLGQRKEERRKRGKIRNSDGGRRSGKRLINARFDKLDHMAGFFPTDPEVLAALAEARAAGEGRQELKGILSSLSQFLLGLQERI